MKVYKPDGELLKLIANFVRPQPKADKHPLADRRIKIGRVRYGASERQGETTDMVDVPLDPTDLIARRTALFGMSRTCKSNTVKKIASSVFMLRAEHSLRGRVGQLILDANGEYPSRARDPDRRRHHHHYHLALNLGERRPAGFDRPDQDIPELFPRSRDRGRLAMAEKGATETGR